MTCILKKNERNKIMEEYKGYYIVYFQDVDLYAVYKENIILPICRAINTFNKKEACYKYIDRLCSGYFRII